MAYLLFLLHDLNQFFRNLLRIAVQNADPADTADFAEPAQKLRKFFLSIEILPIKRRLLCYQDDLLHSVIRKLLCLPEQMLHRNTPEIPPKLWNNAVSTMLIASFRNLEIRIMPSCRHHAMSIHKRKCIQRLHF